MSNKDHKRQKAAMKKRRKAKTRLKAAVMQTINSLSLKSWLMKAREFPFEECLINKDWDEKGTGSEGLIRLLVSRRQSNGNLLFATYLVDTFCLGLKDTLWDANLSQSQYNDWVNRVYFDVEPIKCELDFAHQMIYQAIEYAARFGFKPNRDFKMTQHNLMERGTLPEPHHLEFGKDGKPFFVNGPRDNVKVILDKLERSVGVGNYEFLIHLPEEFVDEDDFYAQDEADSTEE